MQPIDLTLIQTFITDYWQVVAGALGALLIAGC